MIARIAVLAAAIVAAAAMFAGCAKGAPAPKNIGLVTNAAGFGDRSFNDAAYAGLLACHRETSAAIATEVPDSAAEYGPKLTLFATENFDAILAVGYEMAPDLAVAARRFENTHFAIIDAVVNLPNVDSVTFKEEEGSFLAGAVAAFVSKSKIVAFVGGAARNIASDAGEVVDAIADRYQELVVLSALLIVYRADNLGLGASLAAIAGSLMISYTTAKAEAMQVPPPRGYMRRAERAVWLNVAITLTPIAVSLAARGSIPAWGAVVPEIGALLAIGVIANISSVIRTAKIVAALRAKDPSTVPASLPTQVYTPDADAVASATHAVDNTTTFHEEPAR